MALFDKFIPNMGRKGPTRSRTAKRVTGAFVPSGVADTQGTLLLARIDGPEGEKISGYLEGIFAGIPELAVYGRKEALKMSDKGRLFDRLQGAARQGAEWLRADGGTVLIWGETLDFGTAASIRFLAAGGFDGSCVFGLGDHLTFPNPLPTSLDQLVLVSGLASVLSARGGTSDTLAKVLERELKKADDIITNPPKLDPLHLASAYTCYGNVCLALWQAGRKAYLDKGIAAYKAATAAIPATTDPIGWALAETHLAAAFQGKAQQEGDRSYLEAAAKAYSDVAAALGRHNNPMEWALAEVSRGMVLYKLGNKDTSLAKLKESAEAFRDALSGFNRETLPGRWAEAMNQYGTVLMALGERVQGTQILERAIAAFREALEVRQKEIAPLLWAQTANNLGAACVALSKRANNPRLIQEARTYFTGARDIYKQAGNSRLVVVIEKNLAHLNQKQQAQ